MTRSPSLLAADDVLGDVIAWRRAGKKSCLVTLVHIDGTTPRPLGAQMAVAEGGYFTGYLSGGCLEKSVAQEALDVIATGSNRLVRFGKGSKYFDVKLPCGSGLDLYFDQGLQDGVIDASESYRAGRQPFVLATNLETGQSTATLLDQTSASRVEFSNGIFSRPYLPLPRVVLVGGGPTFVALAQVIAAAGFEMDIYTPDSDARSELEAFGLAAASLEGANAFERGCLDAWTAAIISFHEHEYEASVLAHVLRSPCFFIGAIGSKTTHARRMEILAGVGFDAPSLKRIRCPIGLIPSAKSRLTLAVGVVAELSAEAKAAGLLS